VNGQYSLGGTDGVLLERRQAHLPLLLHPAPQRALFLGVGTGATVGAALAYPGLEVDGVELIGEVLEASRLFADENAAMETRPELRLHVDDARAFLRATSERWDVIVSELFLPWTAGTAHLYSADFFAVGRDHLRPGGLYAQWLPLHQMGLEDLRAVVATFASVFPRVELWLAYHRTTAPLAVLVGSVDGSAPSAPALRARLGDSALGRAASANGLGEPDDLALLYVTDGDRLRAATAGIPPITDDDPYLEFTAPAAYFEQVGLGRAALAWIATLIEPGAGPLRGAPAGEELRRNLLEAQLALLRGDGPAELAHYLAAFELAPRSSTVRRALQSIGTSRLAAGDRGTASAIASEMARLAPDSIEAQRLGQAVATR
jgi:spermidine synthase